MLFQRFLLELSSRFPELEKLSTEGEIAEVSLEAGQNFKAITLFAAFDFTCTDVKMSSSTSNRKLSLTAETSVS
jgi:hypothetical protein